MIGRWSATVFLLTIVFATSGTAAVAPQDVTAIDAVLTQYCVTCHNDRLQTAGLVIDPAGLADVGPDAEVWEKVIHKLRSGAMPPVTARRPSPEEYDLAASYLEVELDRVAANDPNPGRLGLLHRLTRTEYQNAIRDLLDLDSLPQEMNFELLLPQDNASSGFDNIADLLFVSPTTMERYLEAARKISRLALGDTTAPEMVNIHRISPESVQNARVEELPFGTRGGLAIESHFPVDGQYVIDVELAGRAREPHQIEISIDGRRMELVTIGGPDTPATQFRIPISAGPHMVGVTFVQRNQALDEATLRPRLRSRGTQPAIGTVTVRGPYDIAGPGDSPTRRRIFTCRPDSTADEVPCAREILAGLVRRAYRRPASDQDLGDLMPFYNEGRADGGFDLGIQKALERLLVSPQFLFRIEREPDQPQPNTAFFISNEELASRMSFFLWSSIPDDELLDLAITGDLKDPVVLEDQVRRMLADPRSRSMVNNFASQWLFLGDVDLKEPDPLLFRHFDETLRHAFERETELFIDSILRADRSVLDLLDADYTFLNERLADHYDIPNVRGSDFRRVTLPDGSQRGGLLGQGSILMLTAYSTRTSPVLRGKFVLDNLLASPPPPPPPDVPALTTKSAESGEALTMREAMFQHRANPVCASCHATMDPIGFALENFDAIGRWRDTDAGVPVDTSGVFPGGASFEGVDGLKRVLLSKPEQFVGAMTEKLLMFATGRNVQYFDRPAIRGIVRDAAGDDYTFASLVLGVVRSAPFQMRMKSSPQAE
jgi:mono/diheme cytochrome c family protein